MPQNHRNLYRLQLNKIFTRNISKKSNSLTFRQHRLSKQCTVTFRSYACLDTAVTSLDKPLNVIDSVLRNELRNISSPPRQLARMKTAASCTLLYTIKCRKKNKNKKYTASETCVSPHIQNICNNSYNNSDKCGRNLVNLKLS